MTIVSIASKKTPLDSFQFFFHIDRNFEHWEIVNGKIGESALNESQPTSFGKKFPFPVGQFVVEDGNDWLLAAAVFVLNFEGCTHVFNGQVSSFTSQHQGKRWLWTIMTKFRKFRFIIVNSQAGDSFETEEDTSQT